MMATAGNVLDKLIAAPITWGVLGLSALAVSLTAKLSVPASQVVLFIAFALVCIALRTLKIPLFLVSATAVGVAFLLLAFWLRPAIVPSYAGVLISKRKPIVETLLSPTGSGDSSVRRLQIGTAHFIFEYVGAEVTPLFTFYGNSDLTVERVNGSIAVSTKIHDRAGNLVAEIYRNEWKVAPPPRTWDRNYNRDTLEILDETGQVVLQVRAKPDRVQLQGIWWGPHGYGFELVQPDTVDTTKGALMLQFGPPPRMRPEDAVPIKRLFLYPSDRHLGELHK